MGAGLDVGLGAASAAGSPFPVGPATGTRAGLRDFGGVTEPETRVQMRRSSGVISPGPPVFFMPEARPVQASASSSPAVAWGPGSWARRSPG